MVSTAYGYGLPVTEYVNGIPMVKSVTYQPGGAIKNYTTGIGIGMDATTQIDQSSTLMPRPSQISTTVPGVPTPLFDTKLYNYDGAGNITCLSQSANCVTPFDTFTYDLRSRLSKAILSGQAQSQYFCYDLFGNLFQKTLSSTPVTCPGTVWTNNRVPTGGYDGRGNQTTNGGDTYAYDGVDRLLTHTTSGLTSKYLYDGAGERQVKISPMLSWTYTFRDESERVSTEYSDGTSSRDNVYLGNLLLASYANAAVAGNGPVWTYYASDHLGSPRLVTNLTGNVVETRKYWPYGEDVTTPSPFQRVRFAAMERDTEGSRYYDHARSHEFGLGRFLSPEPVWYGAPTAPQSWNSYAYGLGNPSTIVDPDGKIPIAAVVILAGGLYGAAEGALEYYGERGEFSAAVASRGFAEGAVATGATLLFKNPIIGGAVVGGLFEVGEELVGGSDLNPIRVAASAGIGAAAGGVAKFLGPRPGTFEAGLLRPRGIGEFLAGRNVTRQTFAEIFRGGYETVAGVYANSILSETSLPEFGVFGRGAFWLGLMSRTAGGRALTGHQDCTVTPSGSTCGDVRIQGIR